MRLEQIEWFCSIVAPWCHPNNNIDMTQMENQTIYLLDKD